MNPAPPNAAPPQRVPRGRLLVLAGGGFGLLIGLWTGLARVGVTDAAGPVSAHGIIMTLGFLGTLIALERAVALDARWAYTGPALSGASVVWLLAGLPQFGAGILLTAAGLVVTIVYGVTLARHHEPHLTLMAVGALAWVAAAALWTIGWSAVRVTPLLVAFLVLTIVGERLELSRLRRPSAAARRRLHAAAGLFAAGAVLSLAHRPSGLVMTGIGMLAQTAWLIRHDIARITIHRPGLPRFAATCMLGGYGWLTIGGLLWIALGMGIRGPLLHDAALHAVFLGFVMSMVMGHAPIILPAVLRTPLPYRPSAWLPLALLHASAAVRIAADLAGSTWLRGWASQGNVAALLLFIGIAGATVRAARHPTRGHGRPTPAAAATSAARRPVSTPGHCGVDPSGTGWLDRPSPPTTAGGRLAG